MNWSSHQFADFISDLLGDGYPVRFRAAGRSMAPAIGDGEMITVKQIRPAEAKKGEILLYRSSKGLIAHRMVAVRRQGQERQFVFQGDASDHPDETVTMSEILGRVVLAEGKARRRPLGGKSRQLWHRLRAGLGRIRRRMQKVKRWERRGGMYIQRRAPKVRHRVQSESHAASSTPGWFLRLWSGVPALTGRGYAMTPLRGWRGVAAAKQPDSIAPRVRTCEKIQGRARKGVLLKQAAFGRAREASDSLWPRAERSEVLGTRDLLPESPPSFGGRQNKCWRALDRAIVTARPLCRPPKDGGLRTVDGGGANPGLRCAPLFRSISPPLHNCRGSAKTIFFRILTPGAGESHPRRHRCGGGALRFFKKPGLRLPAAKLFTSLIALVAIALAGGPSRLLAQGVAVDATTSTTQISGTSLTFSHTVGAAGTNRLLIVGVSLVGGTGASAVTYAGVSMTNVGTMAHAAKCTMQLWQLVAPATGTNNVVVTLPSVSAVAGAISWTGVDQTTPLGTFFSAGAKPAPATVNVTGVNEGEVVVDTVCINSTNDPIVGAGQTEQWRLQPGSGVALWGAASFEPGPDVFPSTGTVTMTWTDHGNEWGIGAAAIKPANATAIRLDSVSAAGSSGGVQIDWQTGYEADNLGFYLHRQQRKERVRVTPDLVAGSAFLTGSGTRLQAGNSYTWWDPLGRLSDQYWLEEVDLQGQRTLHGPIQPGPGTIEQGSRDFRDRQLDSLSSPILSSLGQDGPGKRVFLQGGPALAPEASSGGVWTQKPAAGTKPSQAAIEEAGQRQFDLAAGPAVKFKIREKGLYQITQPQLVQAGLHPGVDPRRLQLFVDGQQVPMVVFGEGDGRLDAADALGFYAAGADTPWSNSRTYWLVEGGEAGKRIPFLLSGLGRSAGSHFPFRLERKEKVIYFAALKNGDADNFFGPALAGQVVKQVLPVHHLASGSGTEARLEVVLQGASQVAHQVRIQLNEVELATAQFFGLENKTMEVSLPSNLLREGDNVVTLIPASGEMDVSLLDTLRLTYSHTYTADADALEFTVAGSAAGAGVQAAGSFPTLVGRQVTISGFSSPAIGVLDVTDAMNVRVLAGVVRRQGPSWAITVSVPGSETRTLFALATPAVKQTAEISANEPSNWHASSGARAVVISPADFLTTLDPLKNLRVQQGYSVAVVNVEDIYDEFSFGNKTPQALRDFLLRAAQEWQVGPQSVLLVGDASFDPRNFLGRGNFDFVPTKLVETALLETASDDWFVDFDLDGVPELAVGRLPVRTASEAEQVIGKIVAYDQQAAGSWSNRALLAADINDGLFNFEQASAALKSSLPEGLSVQQIFRSQSTARDELLAQINQGLLVVGYVGHASVEKWRGNLLASADAASLTNGSRLPFFVSLTCLNGFFQDVFTESLAEALLRAPKGGAVAAWASSGLTSSPGHVVLARELFRLLSQNKGLTLGQAVAQAKNAVLYPKVETTSVDDEDGEVSIGKAAAVDLPLDIRRTWIFFGDPLTRLK